MSVHHAMAAQFKILLDVWGRHAPLSTFTLERRHHFITWPGPCSREECLLSFPPFALCFPSLTQKQPATNIMPPKRKADAIPTTSESAKRMKLDAQIQVS